MGQSLVYNSNNYDDYTERIRYLRSIGDHLLQRIKLLETSMNKQQNQKPLIDEIIINDMVRKVLQTLAEINVCQYLYLVNEYYHFNDYYYKQMCQRYFQDLMLQFNLKLKEKRLNDIKRFLIDDNNDNGDIDFSISR